MTSGLRKCIESNRGHGVFRMTTVLTTACYVVFLAPYAIGWCIQHSSDTQLRLSAVSREDDWPQSPSITIYRDHLTFGEFVIAFLYIEQRDPAE